MKGFEVACKLENFECEGKEWNITIYSKRKGYTFMYYVKLYSMDISRIVFCYKTYYETGYCQDFSKLYINTIKGYYNYEETKHIKNRGNNVIWDIDRNSDKVIKKDLFLNI